MANNSIYNNINEKACKYIQRKYQTRAVILFLTSYYGLHMQVRRWAQCLPQVTLTLLYHHSSNSPVRVPFPCKLNTNRNLTLLVSHQPTHYYASTSVSEFDFRLPVLCFILSAADILGISNPWKKAIQQYLLLSLTSSFHLP